MIAIERHRKIIERVRSLGVAKVTELAQDLGVTEETIRRDLRVLSERGVVTRTHGGAVPLDSDEPPYDTRQETNIDAKDAIARGAMDLVERGTVIALDASSTACRMARLLPDQPLTVVTNSLVICTLLAPRRNIEVVCTGGSLDAEAMAYTGLHARRTLESLNIRTLFFSCRGVDFERGISESNDRHASLKTRMIESSVRRVLLVDSSKLGTRSMVFVGPVGLADVVITERGVREGDAERLAQLRTASQALRVVECG